MGHHVVIVEDEQKIADVLGAFLEDAGYQVTALYTGAGAVQAITQLNPDLVILDLSLPGEDGLSIWQKLRASETTGEIAIIMLTARVNETDRLLGLELGADDYVCKPFSTREVVARVSTVLRRTSAPDNSAQLNFANITLNTGEFVCMADNTVIKLTPVEFKLLEALIQRPRHVFTRANLMDRVYADNRVVSDRTIDSHMNNLRRKLASTAGTDPITAVHGVGYKIE